MGELLKQSRSAWGTGSWKMGQRKALTRILVYIPGTQLLQTQASQPVTAGNALLQALALNDTRAEATSKSIAGTVRVNDLLAIDCTDGVLLDLDFLALLLDCDNGRVCALGEDHHTGSLAIGLWETRQGLRGAGHAVLDFGVSVVLSPCGGFVLVAEDVIAKGEDLGKGILEELRNEASGQGEHEGLVGLSGVLGEGHSCGHAYCQVIATDIEDGGGFDLGPDLRFLQVSEFVVVGGGQVSKHSAVVISDYHATFAGGLAVNMVLDVEALLGAFLAEEFGV